MLVVGWKHMGPMEWTGMAGGPVLIYVVRSVTTAIYDYRINTLSARLKVLQLERNKTIQKLKDATKYDSTLELLEKYGGSENKPRKGKKKVDEDDGSDSDKKKRPQGKQGGTPGRTNLPPPPTANIQRPVSPTPETPGSRPQAPQAPHGAPSPQPPRPDLSASAEFAPNAFDGKAPEIIHYSPPTVAVAGESHWYDRILDTLLGEDETAAKNRIVLLCSRCRLVNGQAPPGTKSLSELGMWKCMSCGASNGEMDEGKRIVQEVLSKRSEMPDANTEDDGADEEEDDDAGEASIKAGDTGDKGGNRNKGKGKKRN